MTSDELRQALDDLCEADGDEKKAREAVREAGEELKAVSARRDALAASVAPILRANRGRTCKGKAWNRLMRKFDDRAIYIDEHGCVAVEPMVEAWDMTIPEEEGEAAEGAPNALVVDLADTLGISEDGEESTSSTSSTSSSSSSSRPLPSDDVFIDDDPCIAGRRAEKQSNGHLVAKGA